MIISMSLKQLAEYGGIFRTPPLSILRAGERRKRARVVEKEP
jgi:hypothetical protein